MAPPKIKPIKLGVNIPQGYTLGRISKGNGPVELIRANQAAAPGANLTPKTGKPVGPAGGDLSGTFPNPVVKALQGIAVKAGTPSDGQVLTYVAANSDWEAKTPSGGGAGTVYSSYYNDGTHNFIAMINSTADPEYVTTDTGIPIYVQQ